MFYELKKQSARAWFNWQIRGILDTPPMPVADAPWRFVSLLGKPTADITMYILSMKAFYRHIRRGRITLITDEETLSQHGATLQRHFPGITFEMLDQIDPGSCQRGGTWERLVYIIRETKQDYIVQMDSDTLVVGKDIDEVKHCLEQNISFTYADNNWRIKPMSEIAAEARANASDYIGDVLERKYGEWPDASRLKFVKGSSGFSGFGKGQFDIAELEAFHTQMKQSLGDRWREWGTEQSGSNFMIANAPGAITLPFPEYQTGPLETPDPRTKFIHFIGSNRYRDNVFANHGRRIVAELMQG